jgi:hypothetical protein
MTHLAIRSMKAAPLAGQRVAVGDPPPEVPQARLSAPTLVETLARPNAINERVDQDDAAHHSRKGCELPQWPHPTGGRPSANVGARMSRRFGITRDGDAVPTAVSATCRPFLPGSWQRAPRCLQARGGRKRG